MSRKTEADRYDFAEACQGDGAGEPEACQGGDGAGEPEACQGDGAGEAGADQGDGAGEPEAGRGDGAGEAEAGQGDGAGEAGVGQVAVQPTFLAIEEHAKTRQLSAPVFAAVRQMKGWSGGKKVEKAEFAEAVDAFLSAPVGAPKPVGGKE